MKRRTIPAPPPNFAAQFATGGWERVELLYGARTDLIRKWIALTGAKCRWPKGGNHNRATTDTLVSNVQTDGI